MNAELRKRIRERAGDRCEYCRIREADEFHAYQVEHVIARQHGGTNEERNLALAVRHVTVAKGQTFRQ